MNFEVSGEVIRVEEVEGGITKRGNNWRGRTFVIRAFDKEQHVIALRQKNNRIDEYTPIVGERLYIQFEIDSKSSDITDNDGNVRTIWKSTNDAYYIRPYEDGEKRAEDIVRKTVHSFEVK